MKGLVPVQFPVLAVKVEPGSVVPEIAGSDVFVGATATAAVPIRVVPKTAPIASDASASTMAPTHLRPACRIDLIRNPLLPNIDEMHMQPAA